MVTVAAYPILTVFMNHLVPCTMVPTTNTEPGARRPLFRVVVAHRSRDTATNTPLPLSIPSPLSSRRGSAYTMLPMPGAVYPVPPTRDRGLLDERAGLRDDGLSRPDSLANNA
jgi:hypothetical protein